MELPEAKEQIAKKYSFKSWEELCVSNYEYKEQVVAHLHEAAHLVISSKDKEIAELNKANGIQYKEIQELKTVQSNLMSGEYISQANKEIEELKAYIEVMHKTEDKYRSELSQLKEEKKDKEASNNEILYEKEKAIGVFQIIVDEQEVKIEELAAENKRLWSQITSESRFHGEDKAQFDRQIQSLQEEIEKQKNTATYSLRKLKQEIDDLTSLNALLNNKNNELQEQLKKKEESVQCPYCNGIGYTEEHAYPHGEDCSQCPVPMPCQYCEVSGRITTKMIKEEIENRRINSSKVNSDDDLPF